MAQPPENIDGIIAAFCMCTRSDGNCSPLSRAELRQLIEQEFTDVMEVRIQPCSWGLPSGWGQGYDRLSKALHTHASVEDSWVPGKGTFFPGKEAFKAQDEQYKLWGDAGRGLGLLECF